MTLFIKKVFLSLNEKKEGDNLNFRFCVFELKTLYGLINSI